jgi:hypothetical protein
MSCAGHYHPHSLFVLYLDFKINPLLDKIEKQKLFVFLIEHLGTSHYMIINYVNVVFSCHLKVYGIIFKNCV